ncbi:MAG: periplasmic heavy metal sensor [Verrucomicrobiales bacterium]
MMVETNRTVVVSIAAAIVLSAATSFFVARQFSPPPEGHRHRDSPAAGNDAFHEWMHANLEITEEQEAALRPVEADYRERRGALLSRIEEAGVVLAHAFESDDPESRPLQEALDEIHAAQGALQRLTLEHFFEMKRHLSPEQTERLLKWTHDSITHEHGH